jgi:predicted RNase H-like HicB family nuclease
MTYTYRVIIEPDEDAYHAYAPALPGCHTWGATVDEARAMARDAIDVYVRSLIADGKEVPTDTGIEVLESFESPGTSVIPAYA